MPFGFGAGEELSGLTVHSHKFPKQWSCDDCGTKIVLENKLGGMFLHCNCQVAQAIMVGKVKGDDNDVSQLLKRKKFPTPQVNSGIASAGY